MVVTNSGPGNAPRAAATAPGSTSPVYGDSTGQKFTFEQIDLAANQIADWKI